MMVERERESVLLYISTASLSHWKPLLKSLTPIAFQLPSTMKEDKLSYTYFKLKEF